MNELSDVEHLARCRAGDEEAYAELFRRHRSSLLAAATAIAGPAIAEDLVAEAFSRTWRLLRSGGGPEYGLKPYLVVAIRNQYLDLIRKDARVTPVEDLGAFERVDDAHDPVTSVLDAALVSQAFGSLPQRWQDVLWHGTVEGRPLEEVATILGTTVPATRQLAHRAREALRIAYLAEHVQRPVQPGCRTVVGLLPRHARGTLPTRNNPTEKVESHLSGCGVCTDAAAELTAAAARLPQLV